VISLLSTTDGITPIHLTKNDAIIFAMIKADEDKKILIACYLELLIRDYFHAFAFFVRFFFSFFVASKKDR
jgi:hypothetical protein